MSNPPSAKESKDVMSPAYLMIHDLAKEIQAPEKGILSRTVFNDDRFKAVLFGFAAGEELSEHTSSMPAILHFLQGEAKLNLDDDALDVKTGAWVRMPMGMRHAIQATTPTIMLLLLLK